MTHNYPPYTNVCKDASFKHIITYIITYNHPPYTYVCKDVSLQLEGYEVASISKLLKITCLCCRISSLLPGSSAKETYTFKEPTNRSHPIALLYLTKFTYISQKSSTYVYSMTNLFTFLISLFAHLRVSLHVCGSLCTYVGLFAHMWDSYVVDQL